MRDLFEITQLLRHPDAVAPTPLYPTFLRGDFGKRLAASASLRLLSLLLVLVLTIASIPVSAAEKSRPVVLLFEVSAGEGVEKTLASSATKALRNYLRESQRVEATIFDRESPAVQRAIVEKKFTADSIASYSSRQDRIGVAKTMSFSYAAGAEITIKPNQANPSDMMLEVKLWLSQAEGDKPGSWETAKSSICRGTGNLDLDNAMQSAASAAVIDITDQALGKLPRIKDKDPVSGEDSTAIGGAQTPVVAQPSITDYMSEGDASLKDGNVVLAIEQYSRAVSVDPMNPELRVKLADAYARKGLYREALDVLAQASALGIESEAITSAKTRIEGMQSGGSAAQPEPPKSDEPKLEPKPAEPQQSSSGVQMKSSDKTAAEAVARLIQGDSLWKQGKPDDAALAYSEAAKLNPREWRAHERLAYVNASMSLFSESRKAIQQLKQIQPNPPADVLDNRYNILQKAFDKSFRMLMSQYESDSANYAATKISRESYYSTINGLSLRLESMAKFLDELAVPELKQPANLRRGIACGLAAQAAASMLDYLETNNTKSKANAATFMGQAKSELDAAAKLDENRVIINKNPAPESEDESAQPKE